MALPRVNAPKYELTIPSSGKKVQYRPYLVKEEKLLMIAMESGDEGQMITAIKDIIQECTFGEVDVTKLPMFDIEYIFVKIRSKSVGESTTVKISCSSCNQMSEVTIDMDKEMKVTESPDMLIKLTPELSIKMRYPSMNDYLDIINSKDKDIDKIFNMIAMSIDTIFAGDDVYDVKNESKKEVQAFIESLNASQFQLVRDFFEAMPQASIHVNFDCEHCGHHHDMDLKGLKSFFN